MGSDGLAGREGAKEEGAKGTCRIAGPNQLLQWPGHATLARLGAIDLRAQTHIPSVLRSDIHEEASVKTKSKTITGLPRHPFGIIRSGGAPCDSMRLLIFTSRLF